MNIYKRKYQSGGTKSKYTSHIRGARKGTRLNFLDKPVTHSTHLMSYSEFDGKYYVYPTLFQDEKGNWYERSGTEAYKEAKKRGEIYQFNTEKEAAEWAGPNAPWKDSSLDGKAGPGYQKGGLRKFFRTKKQKRIDKANQQFASYNESDKVVNAVDDDTYDDEYTVYDTDITNSYGDKGYESTSYNDYVKNIKLYGIDVANQIYIREGKNTLPTEVIKSNPTLGFDPHTGSFNTMDVLNKRYNVGVKNKQVLPEGYDFNTYDPNKAWLDNAPGTVNEVEINEKKPTNIKGSLNSGDILNGWTPEWSLKEIRDMETPETWDDYNPFNAAERLEFAEQWNRFSSPGSKRGGRKTGEYGFFDYWGNAEDTRAYAPSYNYGNDVRKTDPETNDNLIFYADENGNPVGTHYTNGMPYTQRIIDWRDGSGNTNSLNNAIKDDGSKLRAEAETADNVLYRNVPIAGAVATAPLWGPSLYGGLTTAGTATYNTVLPYTSATIGGIPGFTLGNLANASGISYGLTEIGPDTYDFIKDPSWRGLGNIGMDLLGIAGIKGLPKVPKVPKVNVQNVNKIDDLVKSTVKTKSDDIIRVTKNTNGSTSNIHTKSALGPNSRTHPVRGGHTFDDITGEYTWLDDASKIDNHVVAPFNPKFNEAGTMISFDLHKYDDYVSFTKYKFLNRNNNLDNINSNILKFKTDLSNTVKNLQDKGFHHMDMHGGNVLIKQNKTGNILDYKIIDPVGYTHNFQKSEMFLKNNPAYQNFDNMLKFDPRSNDLRSIKSTHFKHGGVKQKGGIKTQGFSNIQVPGINWGKGVPELKGTESRQGVNVSGINMSRDFKLNKNLNLSLSNPAVVHARPTLDGSFVSKFGKTKVLPFEPRVSLTYNIPNRKRNKVKTKKNDFIYNYINKKLKRFK